MSGVGKVRRHASAGEQVYRRVRQAIFSGAIEPGSRLVETALAAELGVSRTPVREALAKLEADGLVMPSERVGGGLIVQPVSEGIEEVFRLRLALEGCAAFLAAKQITEAELADLNRLCDETDRLLDVADSSGLAKADEEFHLKVAESVHSERVYRLVNYQYTASKAIVGEYEFGSTHLTLHREIATALGNRDAARAESAMRECISTLFSDLSG